MKKLLIALSLIAPLTAIAGSNLPFVGTKHFSFGGVPAFNTSYTLSIKQNNSMTLKEQTCYSEGCDKAITLYQGKYQSLIKLNSGEYAGGYIQLDSRGVKLLNRNKKIERGCDEANTGNTNEPCTSQYY